MGISRVWLNQIYTIALITNRRGTATFKVSTLPHADLAGGTNTLICREVHPWLPSPNVESMPAIGCGKGLLGRLLAAAGYDAAASYIQPEQVTIALAPVSAACVVAWTRVGGCLKRTPAAAVGALHGHIVIQNLTPAARNT